MLMQIEVLEDTEASINDIDSLISDDDSFRLKFGAEAAPHILLQDPFDI